MLYAAFVAIRSHTNRNIYSEQSFKYIINKKSCHIFIAIKWNAQKSGWECSELPRTSEKVYKAHQRFKPFRAKTSNRVLFFVRQQISCCLITSWPLCQVHRYSGSGTTKFHHTQAFKMPGNERFICQQRGLWLKCLRTAIREKEKDKSRKAANMLEKMTFPPVVCLSAGHC